MLLLIILHATIHLINMTNIISADIQNFSLFTRRPSTEPSEPSHSRHMRGPPGLIPCDPTCPSHLTLIACSLPTPSPLDGQAPSFGHRVAFIRLFSSPKAEVHAGSSAHRCPSNHSSVTGSSFSLLRRLFSQVFESMPEQNTRVRFVFYYLNRTLTHTCVPRNNTECLLLLVC